MPCRMTLHFDSALRLRSDSVKTPGLYGYAGFVVHRSTSLASMYSFFDAVMIIANQWVENQWPYPDLLVPTLRRFASDPNPAIRALILRRLPYLLSKQPELGWEVFDLTTLGEDQRLWEIAEPCRYYSYYNNFARVRPVLDHIEQSTT